MKYFFLVGERSGDLHTSNLAAQLKNLDPGFSGKGFGGEAMQQQGIDLVCGLERLSFMGFWEVVKNLRTIRQNFKMAKQAILDFQPDVIILVDYPGFNLRLAKWCKQNGFKIAYYILPQVWAWKENRIKQLKEYCDCRIGVLPFEKEFYAKHKVDMKFVGHPLLDLVPLRRGQGEVSPLERGRGVSDRVALLPGSRKQEINRLMPIFIDVARQFSQENFVVAGLTILEELYPKELPSNMSMAWDNTYSVLQNSKAAIVCSGTATLETALLQVPQVVVYKTGFINAQIVKRVAKVSFASLPNLIVGEKIIEELLQWDCTPEKIGNELTKLMQSDPALMYAKLSTKIGEPGASAKAAKIIFNLAG